MGRPLRARCSDVRHVSTEWFWKMWSGGDHALGLAARERDCNDEDRKRDARDRQARCVVVLQVDDRGEARSIRAAELAISSPLLEASIDGAHGVLLSIPPIATRVSMTT